MRHHEHSMHASPPSLHSYTAGLARPPTVVPPNLYVKVIHDTTSPLKSAGSTPTQILLPHVSSTSSGTVEAVLTSPRREPPPSSDGVFLGVQALEQQQANWEAAKRHSGRPPQSTATSQYLRTRSRSEPPTMTVRIENSDFMVQSNDPAHDEFELRPSPHADSGTQQYKPLVVYGYLQKQTRNGVWQKRFFETDGEHLMYYKSSKRSKLLASLDLAKVGVIQEDPADLTGCTFTIQVAGRPYYLRAEDRSTCKDWVINLNRVREARVQLGRMKLVEISPEEFIAPATNSFRKESGDEYVSRVVVKANRSRTHGLRDETEILQIYGDPSFQENRPPNMNTANQPQMVLARPAQPSFLDFPMGEVLARWDKKRTRIAAMRNKLIRWARQVKIIRCVGDERDVITLNAARPIPPGPHGGRQAGMCMNDGTDTVGDSEAGNLSHNDHSIAKSASDDMRAVGHSAWIAKETQINSQTAPMERPIVMNEMQGPVPQQVYQQSEEEDARSLS